MQPIFDFMDTAVRDKKPFFVWYAPMLPHTPHDPPGRLLSKYRDKTNSTHVAKYWAMVEWFDETCGQLLEHLDKNDLARDTIVVFLADNGWIQRANTNRYAPRSKQSQYDGGLRTPIIIKWPGHVKAGESDRLASTVDLAPTILEAAGLKPLEVMTGRSLLPLFKGEEQSGRDRVFIERERHANVRRGDLSYPMRAIRTQEYLYIRNFRPDRWPAGDPEKYFSVGPFGDIDGGPTKDLLLKRRDDSAVVRYFTLATAKRPEEELYDLRKDPHQLENVAANREYATAKSALRAALLNWMRETNDPRATGATDPWDRYPYYGPPGRDR